MGRSSTSSTGARPCRITQRLASPSSVTPTIAWPVKRDHASRSGPIDGCALVSAIRSPARVVRNAATRSSSRPEANVFRPPMISIAASSRIVSATV